MIQLLLEYQGKEAAKDMASDGRIPIVIIGTGSIGMQNPDEFVFSWMQGLSVNFGVGNVANIDTCIKFS
ncbi:hypothetical protein EG832_00270 [bacterium]|nr:hypothetical protein [bacterium]